MAKVKAKRLTSGSVSLVGLTERAAKKIKNIADHRRVGATKKSSKRVTMYDQAASDFASPSRFKKRAKKGAMTAAQKTAWVAKMAAAKRAKARK